MRASYLVRQGELAVKRVPVPTLDADQVLVQVASVGVCGSDVHYYQHGAIGPFVVRAPMVLGHDARLQFVHEDDVTVSVPRLFFGYATGTNLMFPFAVGASVGLFAERPTPENDSCQFEVGATNSMVFS